MPSIGTGTVDIRTFFGSAINAIKSRANKICASSCDGLILRMHYNWTFYTLLLIFLIVWHSWYHRDVITCVSHFDANMQVRLDYLNVCLSYPYTEVYGSRRYLLFYRWISWSFLLLAGVYYIPRKVSKNFDNARCKKLLEDLAANAHRYDQAEKELVERTARYMVFNLRTHNGLYWKYLTVNFLALLIDIFAMQYFDFILEGRFIQYGYKAYPFDRDPQTFSDYMSETFPPFALCQLTTEHQLVNKRAETFGCHLTIMELYEKIFLFLWVWLIIQPLVTCCYIIYLLTMWFPCVRFYLLRPAKPAHASHTVKIIIQNVCKNCKIGDIYLLYRVKSHLSHAKFYELMVYLSNPNLFNKQTQQPKAPPMTPEHKRMPTHKEGDALRKRKPSAPQNIPATPDYVTLSRNPNQNAQSVPLLPNPGNRSILIEDE